MFTKQGRRSSRPMLSLTPMSPEDTFSKFGISVMSKGA